MRPNPARLNEGKKHVSNFICDLTLPSYGHKYPFPKKRPSTPLSQRHFPLTPVLHAFCQKMNPDPGCVTPVAVAPVAQLASESCVIKDHRFTFSGKQVQWIITESPSM